MNTSKVVTENDAQSMLRKSGGTFAGGPIGATGARGGGVDFGSTGLPAVGGWGFFGAGFLGRLLLI